LAPHYRLLYHFRGLPFSFSFPRFAGSLPQAFLFFFPSVRRTPKRSTLSRFFACLAILQPPFPRFFLVLDYQGFLFSLPRKAAFLNMVVFLSSVSFSSISDKIFGFPMPITVFLFFRLPVFSSHLTPSGKPDKFRFPSSNPFWSPAGEVLLFFCQFFQFPLFPFPVLAAFSPPRPTPEFMVKTRISPLAIPPPLPPPPLSDYESTSLFSEIYVLPSLDFPFTLPPRGDCRTRPQTGFDLPVMALLFSASVCL